MIIILSEAYGCKILTAVIKLHYVHNQNSLKADHLGLPCPQAHALWPSVFCLLLKCDIKLLPLSHLQS